LMQHNGAGKTTTINMLTGMLSPESGDAFVDGWSAAKNMDEVRDLMGVCPQVRRPRIRAAAVKDACADREPWT